eukprot:2587058-Rhodomonas_salina.1
MASQVHSTMPPVAPLTLCQNWTQHTKNSTILSSIVPGPSTAPLSIRLLMPTAKHDSLQSVRGCDLSSRIVPLAPSTTTSFCQYRRSHSVRVGR